MATTAVITARVDADTKESFVSMATLNGVSESALLKRLILTALVGSAVAKTHTVQADPTPRAAKISVRLRPDDQLLLRERAAARALPTGTYVSLLIRSHLRQLAPLPTLELDVLKRSLAEVSVIGRNLNQIARALNQGDPTSTPNRADLQALLRALTALRDHFKAVINANLSSWHLGYEKENYRPPR